MTYVNENKIKILIFVMLVGISLFTMIDILFDVNEGVPFKHLVHEGFLWLFSMIGAFFQFKIISCQKKELVGLGQKIQELYKVNDALKLEQRTFEKKISHLSDEFLKYIDEQFNLWNFSRGEKEIALLLIKGLSMKEIAIIRGSGEITVRQQASQIYKKSSLSGRLELSAFFLDDLLALSKLPVSNLKNTKTEINFRSL